MLLTTWTKFKGHLISLLSEGVFSKLFELVVFLLYRILLTMPAYSSNDKTLSTKLVTLYSENAKIGVPSHQGVVVSFDPMTGTPVAVSIKFYHINHFFLFQ